MTWEQIQTLCEKVVSAENDASVRYDGMLIEAAKGILKRLAEDTDI